MPIVQQFFERCLLSSPDGENSEWSGSSKRPGSPKPGPPCLAAQAGENFGTRLQNNGEPLKARPGSHKDEESGDCPQTRFKPCRIKYNLFIDPQHSPLVPPKHSSHAAQAGENSASTSSQGSSATAGARPSPWAGIVRQSWNVFAPRCSSHAAQAGENSGASLQRSGATPVKQWKTTTHNSASSEVSTRSGGKWHKVAQRSSPLDQPSPVTPVQHGLPLVKPSPSTRTAPKQAQSLSPEQRSEALRAVKQRLKEL